MISVSELSIAMGGLYCLVHLPLIVTPVLTRRVLCAFPRNRVTGAVLSAVALVWAAWNVNAMPLGMIDNYKVWLWVLCPVVYLLVLWFMNELLAVRALGGILMLAACPVLEIQRLNGSCWTWVLAGLAYVWVLAGMIFVLSPYRFRHAIERCCTNDGICRILGAAGVLAGALLIGLGVKVF